MTTPHGLPSGIPVILDDRVRVRAGGSVVLGGAPWGLLRLRGAAVGLVRRLEDAAGPLVPEPHERDAVDLLVARGVLHPMPAPQQPEPTAGVEDGVEVVVPAYRHGPELDRCLSALLACGLAPDRVVVVDDATAGSEVGDVARRHGVRLLRHDGNRGPAAGRNTGLAATVSPLVAFVDADCEVTPGWLPGLLPHFQDPRVGAVAPRIRPRSGRDTLLARHEAVRSALDMGSRPELVRPGAALAFLPSATLLVRRSALAGVPAAGFDERLRLGEDVDLVWRLVDGDWLVRYVPQVQVDHQMRDGLRAWAVRRFEYGTSAAELDRRHPGRLAPARPSGWNLATLTALVVGRPVVGGAAAAAVAAVAAGTLGRHLRTVGVDPRLAVTVVGQGVLADAVGLGHALRREWWPIGWLVLAAAARPGRAGTGSRGARLLAASMLVPVAMEWARHRPRVDPLRYAGLRLLEDAAYGTGVLVSAVRSGRATVLLPRLRRAAPGRRLPAAAAVRGRRAARGTA